MFVARSLAGHSSPTSMEPTVLADDEPHPTIIAREHIPLVVALGVGIPVACFLGLFIYYIHGLLRLRRLRTSPAEIEAARVAADRMAREWTANLAAKSAVTSVAPIIEPNPTYRPWASFDSQMTLRGDVKEPCYEKRQPGQQCVVLAHPQRAGIPPVICTAPTNETMAGSPRSDYTAQLHPVEAQYTYGTHLHPESAEFGAPSPSLATPTPIRRTETLPPRQDDEDDDEDVADMYAAIPDVSELPIVPRTPAPRRTQTLLPLSEAALELRATMNK